MKKNFYLLVLAGALALGGCTNTNNNQAKNQTELTQTNENTTNEEATPSTTEEMTEEEKAELLKYEELKKKLLAEGKTPQLEPLKAGDEYVILKTSMGDITIKLFPEEAPKTVENFVTHCKEGYYDGIIFHRVINDFMVQGGDPTGTGMGGESIWGEGFEDEFSPNLYHFRGAISMANSGPSTNGSQFFIVQNNTPDPTYFDDTKAYAEMFTNDLMPNPQTGGFVRLNYSEDAKNYYNENGGTPFLDYSHAVFGMVVEGMDVVDAMATVQTGEGDKPLSDIVINSTEVKIYE